MKIQVANPHAGPVELELPGLGLLRNGEEVYVTDEQLAEFRAYWANLGNDDPQLPPWCIVVEEVPVEEEPKKASSKKAKEE